MIDGILWRLRTGAPWRDIPERYGPWQSCYERFKRWEEDGTWARLLEEMQVKDDSFGQVEFTVSIDSTMVRAHQHAAGARKKGGRRRDDRYQAIANRQALGRSRGGLTTTFHLLVEACGLPLVLHLIGGNIVDCTAFEPCWPSSGYAARRRPPAYPARHAIGDKGYSSCKIRLNRRRRGSKRSSPSGATRSPTASAEAAVVSGAW
uniref:IS5 family transposase n=1 Tax=Nonomuraea sp. CA-252377 TaxID=3240003 RepID=UPI003F493993